MTEEGRKFLVDANVLIAAHRAYYAFELCPGFWESVKAGFAAGRIFKHAAGGSRAATRWRCAGELGEG